jgi:signal transduction histidine kinase
VEDNQTATQLYHIAQEAVTNSLRHARARHIAIRLDGDDKTLALRVSDDAWAFPTSTSTPREWG